MKEQVVFSPREFAALFNKEQSWGYRQIYAGRVTTISEYGRILIPASEVERILESASRYEGRKKANRTKKELESMKPEIQSAWSAYVRNKSKPTPGMVLKTAPSTAQRREARRAMLKRLFKT